MPWQSGETLHWRWLFLDEMVQHVKPLSSSEAGGSSRRRKLAGDMPHAAPAQRHGRGRRPMLPRGWQEEACAV
jgi:hypothetical protein